MKKLNEENVHSFIIFGFLVVFVIFFIWCIYISFAPVSEEARFEVVDQYKNCDVVRYQNLGRYYYFLHCMEGAAPQS